MLTKAELAGFFLSLKQLKNNDADIEKLLLRHEPEEEMYVVTMEFLSMPGVECCGVIPYHSLERNREMLKNDNNLHMLPALLALELKQTYIQQRYNMLVEPLKPMNNERYS